MIRKLSGESEKRLPARKLWPDKPGRDKGENTQQEY